MMKLRRILALGMASMLLLTMLTGCRGDNKQEESLQLVTQEMAEDTVATVNGEAITLSDMQYYIYNAALVRLYQMDPTFQKGIQGAKWNQKLEDGRTLEQAVLDDALNDAAADLLAIQKGQDAGFDFPEEPKQQIADSMKKFIENYGEEAFLLNLTAMGVSSGDAYAKLFERTAQAQNVREDVQTNLNQYIENPEVLQEYRSGDKATVQHILIMTKDGKYEDPLATANEVLEKAKAGEDFAKLIAEYNEDPGATAAGYTFGPGEMVKEFEEASFALDFNEISDLVKTTYGYHIIKRLVGAAELENYWMAQADIQKKEESIKQISVETIMNTIDKAQNTLREQAKGE